MLTILYVNILPLDVVVILLSFMLVFLQPAAMFALQALYYLQQFRLSVRLSVTRRYCVKTTAHMTVQFAPLDSKMCLVL